MIKKLLKNLNFSEKEAMIYLALIEMGQGTATQLYKKLNINRTSVYDIIESLQSKGLVSNQKKKGATYFQSLPPEKLLNYLEREKNEVITKIEKQKEAVSDLLPELISMQGLYRQSKPKVQFFEGVKGMREAYEDTLTAKNLILGYANVETMHKGLPNFFPEYYKRRTKAKIFTKAIVPQNKLSIERATKDSEEMRTIKFLPSKELDFSPEVNIYNDKVMIASWKEQMAIIIESREYADLQRIIYDLAWDSLSKKPN